MTQHAVAVLGISGVGKSTLLRKVSAYISFQHLQASSLIREGRRVREARDFSADALRHANIDENQQLLIAGYKQSVDPQAKLVILDGHSVIDTTAGLVLISPQVFGALGINSVIFLADTPSEIVQRRMSDVSRERPIRSADDLKAQQDAALLNALIICLELKVPLSMVTPTQIEYVRCLLLRIERGMGP